MPIKFDAIFCDDIRREDNGKIFMIGVYPTNITLALPATLPLAVWVRFTGAKEGKNKIAFRIELPGETGIEGNGELLVNENSASGSIALPKLPCKLSREGKISIHVVLNDEPEQLAGAIDVIDTSSSES